MEPPKKHVRLTKGNGKPLGCSLNTADKPAAAEPAKSVVSSTSMASDSSDEEDELTYDELDGVVGNYLRFEEAATERTIILKDGRQKVCTTLQTVGFNGKITILNIWGGHPDDKKQDKIGTIFRNGTK